MRVCFCVRVCLYVSVDGEEKRCRNCMCVSIVQRMRCRRHLKKKSLRRKRVLELVSVRQVWTVLIIIVNVHWT